MASAFNTIRVLQGLSLFGTAYLAGNIASISTVTVPALLKSKSTYGVSSTTLAQEWQNIFDAGKALAPPIALTTAAACGYLAWTSRHLAGTPILYAASAALTLGIVPFTIVFMSSTNNALSGHAASSKNAKGVGKLTDQRVDDLIVRWGKLNLARSMLPVVAFVLAFVAL